MALLSDSELELAQRLGFSVDVCQLVKDATGGVEMAQAMGIVEDDEEPIDGVSAVMEHDAVYPALRQLQPQLLERGYRAFHGEVGPFTGATKDTLVLLKTTDDREVVRQVGTTANERGLETDEILHQLDAWTAAGGKFVVTGAAMAWIEMDIEAVPSDDICAFAAEVYAFCPDSVEQGIGSTPEEDAPDYYAAARLRCPGEIPGSREIIQEAWEGEADEETFARIGMGIKIVAEYIAREKSVYLWWD